jgi:Ubiquitin-activating enzyme E1 FCCH domain
MSSPIPPNPYPLVMTAQGPVPTPPATLRAAVVAGATALSPGVTTDLPGTLVEDVVSTDVAALSVIDSERVEVLNDISPYGANAYMSNQLGSIYGVPIGVGSNTSVEVQFFDSTPGFPIIPGFTVSDGQFQYIIQDGGIIDADGNSGLLSALATQQGSWPIPPNVVVDIVTSIPTNITLNVTNPQNGFPGSSGQLISDYQAQVLQAGLAASMGMTRYLKTLLQNVPGVQSNLISARSVTAPQGWPGWEIIVGGGDNFQVAAAIFYSLFDISTLVGSQLMVTEITNASPAQVTTNLNHGYASGQVVVIEGVTMTSFPNGTNLTITVVDEKNFTIGENSSAWGTYISGGVVTPNFRNVIVTINDVPDAYDIPFVSPPQQSVAVAVTWNTDLLNFAGAVAVQQLAIPAIIAYVNAIFVGQPLNLFALQAAFQTAVSQILPPANLTRLVIDISINSIPTSPESGTGAVYGDPESYFFASTSTVTVIQG